jgi:hypothetical protein
VALVTVSSTWFSLVTVVAGAIMVTRWRIKIGPAALENERGGAGFAGIPFRHSLLNLVAFSVFGTTHWHP